MSDSLTAQILAVLPQTQCTRCGYPDCAAYALAIATGPAAINQCPPGGAQGIQRLAAITRQAATTLNPANGTEGPRCIAIVDENWCIGCTLCIDACPTDAILGSNKLMHTVIEPHCTGCELCIPVCPVDCISLENVSGEATGWAAWSEQAAAKARARYEVKLDRKKANSADGGARHQESLTQALNDLPGHSQITDPAELDKKRAVVEAALARARARKATLDDQRSDALSFAKAVAPGQS